MRFSQGNFLPRARREFIRNGILPVILDNPSDQQRRDERRLSREPRALQRHPRGARRARQALSRACRCFSSAPAAAPCRWLTSRAGCRPTSRARSSPRRCSIPAGGQRARPVLAGFNWSQIKVPLLFVHHEDDGCGATPYREATRVTRYPLVALITVQGGKPPESGPCEPLQQPRLLRPGSRDGGRDRRLDAGKTVSEKYPVSVLRRHHLPVVVPAVPGAAADRAPDPALVRRQRRRVDDLHAVLPGAAAGRLCLRAFPDAAVEQAGRGRDPHRAARSLQWRRCRSRRARHGSPSAPRNPSRASCSSSGRASACLISCWRRPAPCCRPGSRARGPGRTPIACSRSRTSHRCIALIGYPFLVEPFFGGVEQVAIWSWLFAAFAILCAVMAWRTPRRAIEVRTEDAVPGAGTAYVQWIALSATGSVLLLAVTNHLTQNVAAVPLLWLVPLTLYLASFIITFEGKGWYQLEWLWGILLALIVAMGWLLVDSDFDFDLVVQLAVFLPGLFVGLPFLPRRALQAAAGAEPAHRLLPRGVGGRRARRPAGGGGGAAGLQRLLRARRRAGGARHAGGAALRLAQPGGALRRPGGAARRRRERRVRRLSLPARRARRHAQLLRRAAREGVRAGGRGVAPAPPGARRDHARRAIHARQVPRRAQHLLPRGFGHRRRDPLAARGPPGARRA